MLVLVSSSQFISFLVLTQTHTHTQSHERQVSLHGLELVDALFGVALANLLKRLVFVASLLEILLVRDVLARYLVRILGLVEVLAQLLQLDLHLLVLVQRWLTVLLGRQRLVQLQLHIFQHIVQLKIKNKTNNIESNKTRIIIFPKNYRSC